MSTNTECRFEGCDKIAKTKKHGLCTGHQWQYDHGTKLSPLRSYKSAVVPIEGYRRCTICDKVKEEKEFYSNWQGYLRSQCIPCFNERQRG